MSATHPTFESVLLVKQNRHQRRVKRLEGLEKEGVRLWLWGGLSLWEDLQSKGLLPQ